MAITNSTIEYKRIRDARKHVLLRPDAYGMGSIENGSEEQLIADANFHIFPKKITINQGLLHIFNEVLTNAIDNVFRSEHSVTKMTKLDVNVDETRITLRNDGIAISVRKNDEGIYIPEMIFGQLMSSSNYNDKKKRLTAGRNGLGVKLTNIFSTEFTIKIYDEESALYYEQNWSKNMSEKTDPIVKKNSKFKHNFVEISYIADFKRFGVSGYSKDMISLIRKKILDACAVTKIKVKLNGDLIPISSLEDYAKLYSDVDEIYKINTADSEVIITSNDDYEVVSFANGVLTREGGVHVDAWTDCIFKSLVDKFNAKKTSKKESKTKTIKRSKKSNSTKKNSQKVSKKDVKQFFRIFISTHVDRPTFNSQEKTKLTGPTIEPKLHKNFVKDMMKWSFVEKVENLLRSRELLSLKKTQRKRGFKSIPNYDPANFSGTRKSLECSLIICEGLSAKTYVTKGIEVGMYGKSGRDWFGIFPIRGKLLNVRNATISSIAKNAEISGLIQVLNLKYETDYTKDANFDTLHYGQIICLTDADYDGMHIEGLIINFFHTLFPTLLRRKTPFIVSMRTPIVRIIPKRGEEIKFYNISDFEKYKRENEISSTTKVDYFKGLGTSENKQVGDSFGQVVVEYVRDPLTNEAIDKAFSKANADLRKKWLSEFDPKNVENPNSKKLTISSFIDKRLILYSIDDCARMIPNVMDGLKQSLRKILYASFLKKLKYTGDKIKVSQFAGYIAEHTEYHHGEQILGDTISTLAHAFVGSNNIPLLYRAGQFGSRLEGGKDCSASRYIHTKLDMLTRLIFREEDEKLLDYIVEEGNTIEPKYYVPIIPMILVNGCKAGIGTGWACTIPCFNPKDLISCIKVWLNEECWNYDHENQDVIITPFPELIPWYRGFKGSIEQKEKHKFLSTGVIERKKDVVTVTELPIGMWTNRFKEFAESLLEEKKIKKLINHSTATKVHFDIVENDERVNITFLKLKTNLNTNNMVLFTKEGRIKVFKTLDEILNYFCIERYSLYIKRKKYLIGILKQQLKYEKNKYRFLKEVINGDLRIHKRDEEKVIADLVERKYDKKNESYEYLLSMQIRSFTQQKLENLMKNIEKIKKELEETINTSEKDMWIKELDEFDAEYDKWLKIIEKEDLIIDKKEKRKK